MTSLAMLGPTAAWATSALLVGVVAAAHFQRPKYVLVAGSTLGIVVIGFCARTLLAAL